MVMKPLWYLIVVAVVLFYILLLSARIATMPSFSSGAEELSLLDSELNASFSPGSPPASETMRFSPSVAHKGILYSFIMKSSPEIPHYKRRYAKAGGRVQWYLKELERSINSAKEHNPQLPIAVVTDVAASIPQSLKDKIAFLIENQIPVRSFWGEKVPTMLQSPFNKTLLVDLDTEICDSLAYAFSICCSKFDMAMVREPFSKKDFKKAVLDTEKDLSQSISKLYEFNSGVIGYRKSSEMLDLLTRIYWSHTSGGDQHFYNLFGSKGYVCSRSSQRLTILAKWLLLVFV